MKIPRTLSARLLPLAAAALIAGCQGFGKVGELAGSLGAATGLITEEQGKSIGKSANAVEQAAHKFTPEQEYYIGRTVIASVLKEYKPLDRQPANEYVNRLGQALAAYSDMPETFKGYRFLVAESDDINAFAAPGGFIVVTRGMLRLCATEDALAAVLAHEIGHVQHQHGIKAIKKSRITGAVSTILLEAGKSLGGEELAQLSEAFEGSINDITQTLMNNGYARSSEREADKAAVTILQRSGYDPNALVDMLQEMKKNLKPGGKDFAKTHPDPNDRIADVKTMIAGAPRQTMPPARQARYAAFSKGL